jgi:rhomboid protease GluP
MKVGIMDLKLNKTYLSRPHTTGSLFMSVIALSLMVIFFGFDSKNFYANGYLVFEKKEYWRLFTTTLLHADLDHLAHNSFYLLGLSYLLHSYFGFWVFPVLSVLIGGLINLVTLSFYPPMVHLVGVSGVIYFMASFWLTLYLLIERRQKLRSRIIYAFGVSLILLFPQVFYPEVSYLSHGTGFVLGIVTGAIYFAINFKKIRDYEEWVEVKKDPVDVFDVELNPEEYFITGEPD